MGIERKLVEPAVIREEFKKVKPKHLVLVSYNINGSGPYYLPGFVSAVNDDHVVLATHYQPGKRPLPDDYYTMRLDFGDINSFGVFDAESPLYIVKKRHG